MIDRLPLGDKPAHEPTETTDDADALAARIRHLQADPAVRKAVREAPNRDEQLRREEAAAEDYPALPVAADIPPPHDELLCGLDVDGMPARCPGCVAAHRLRSLLRADLERIANQFAAADRRAKQAPTLADREEAEAVRRQAAGEFWAMGSEVAHLFLLLLRVAAERERETVRLYLRDLLREEIGELAVAVARLEGGRR
jgi:hypothetical protein